MVSAIYIALAAFLIIWLSLHVIKVRRKHQISIGDEGNMELKTAMAAQANAVEFLPIGLLLLFVLESNQASVWIIHAAGLLLLIGRLVHARSLLADDLKGRVLGMKITINVIIALGVLNLFYVFYNNFLT